MQENTAWIASWLGRFYSVLRSEFGGNPFKIEEVQILGIAGDNNQKTRLALSKLCANGWIARLSRGKYVALEPEYIFLSIDSKWADALRQEKVAILPCLQAAVGSIVRLYGSNLVSIALFGSSARRGANKTSDIDLLIVADGLPPIYSKRLEELEVVQESCSKIRTVQWLSSGEYHTVDLMVLSREELVDHNSLFLLDLTRDALIIYDRKEFLASTLDHLRNRLAETGAQRIETPSGAWYWDLKPATTRRAK
jgi:uncharacterized protein